MKLKIENCNNINFIIYLVDYIKKYLILHATTNKTIKIENYINSLLSGKNKHRKYISCKEIIIAGAYNLHYRKIGNIYEIYIDSNQKLFGLNAKLYDLCKLINYGTMSIRGYSIFTEAFNQVENNIEFLYMTFIKGF